MVFHRAPTFCVLKRKIHDSNEIDGGWLTAHVEDAKKMFGNDWWSYGLEGNMKALETFTRYHHEQGLSPKKLEVSELFAPEALEAFKI